MNKDSSVYDVGQAHSVRALVLLSVVLSRNLYFAEYISNSTESVRSEVHAWPMSPLLSRSMRSPPRDCGTVGVLQWLSDNWPNVAGWPTNRRPKYGGAAVVSRVDIKL